MKFTLVAVLGLLAIASAAPAERTYEVLRRSDDGPNPDGSYRYSFETENGIKADEEGQIKDDGNEGINSVKGSYSYLADDGSEVQVQYTADENGFVAKGSAVPQIPPGILKALEWIALHPEEDNL